MECLTQHDRTPVPADAGQTTDQLDRAIVADLSPFTSTSRDLALRARDHVKDLELVGHAGILSRGNALAIARWCSALGLDAICCGTAHVLSRRRTGMQVMSSGQCANLRVPLPGLAGMAGEVSFGAASSFGARNVNPLGYRQPFRGVKLTTLKPDRSAT